MKYFGIALRSEVVQDLEQKVSRKRKTALPEIAVDQPKAPAAPSPAADEAKANAAALRAAADQMQASLKPQSHTMPGKAEAA